MEKILELRTAGAIQRYHTARTIRTQSVAEHSFGVAQLALLVQPNCSLEVLSAAIHHDLPELVTGDIPAPVKWENPELGTLLKDLENKFNQKHNLGTALSSDDWHLLKWCDMAELVLWCMEELELGNQGIRPLIVRGINYLEELGHPNTIAKELHDGFKERSK